MRCLSCNNILDEAEESLTYEWNEPIGLCLDCLEETDLNQYGDDYENN